MPEIEFAIDPATGRLELQVKGITGPTCEDVARLVRELLAVPDRDQNTSEYYLRPQVRPQVRSKPER